MALVVQTILRISVSNRRDGVNSSQAFSHSRTIAGVFLAPGVGEGGEPLQPGIFGRGRVDGLEGFRDLVPVLAGGIPEGVLTPVPGITLILHRVQNGVALVKDHLR